MPAVFALGVLFAMDSPGSRALPKTVLPYHATAFLRRCEKTRLANYLTVIDIQDGFGGWSEAA